MIRGIIQWCWPAVPGQPGEALEDSQGRAPSSGPAVTDLGRASKFRRGNWGGLHGSGLQSSLQLPT